MGATGYIPKSLEVVNAVLDSLGIDQLPEGTVIEDILPDATTRSGEGMETPFEGTRTSSGAGNDNDNNLDNTA